MSMEENMAGFAQQGSPHAASPVSKIKIDLTIIAVANGEATDYKLEGEDGDDKKHVANKKITIPSGSRDVKIEYKLHADSSLGLEFNQSDPIWVSRTTMCPTSYSSDVQIDIVEVQSRKLTLNDHNTDTVDLGYTIVLTGPSGQVLVDPIIKNFV